MPWDRLSWHRTGASTWGGCDHDTNRTRDNERATIILLIISELRTCARHTIDDTITHNNSCKAVIYPFTTIDAKNSCPQSQVTQAANSNMSLWYRVMIGNDRVKLMEQESSSSICISGPVTSPLFESSSTTVLKTNCSFWQKLKQTDSNFDSCGDYYSS